jgi:hypothetical protein
MVLALHIGTAVIGLVGAYIWAVPMLLGRVPTRILWVGIILTLVGLVGVICSGIFLFLRDPASLLQSGKFLSNMTVLGVLAAAEIFSLLTATVYARPMRIVSLWSWTWIFGVALLNPSLPYGFLLNIYLVGLCSLILAAWYLGVLQSSRMQ